MENRQDWLKHNGMIGVQTEEGHMEGMIDRRAEPRFRCTTAGQHLRGTEGYEQPETEVHTKQTGVNKHTLSTHYRFL